MAETPVCTTSFKLNNGMQFPAVGLGTWQGSKGTEDAKLLEDSIIHALDAGYRMIDTAQHYGVEANVGNAIRASGVPREEITVVTKFWGEWHHDPAEALRTSLRELGLEYIDVFLMHWPWATTPAPEKRHLLINDSPTFVETWTKMEGLVGPSCQSIGVSNFTQKTLDTLLASASIVPSMNQVELHALNPNFKLVPYCQDKGIHVVSWSTLGGASKDSTNQILEHELFTDIAKAHDCSVGVVSLSWAVQRGISVIPKSGSSQRIRVNVRLVTLSDDEMAKMNKAQDMIGKVRLADEIESMKIEINGQTTLQGWSKVDFGWEDEQGNWLC